MYKTQSNSTRLLILSKYIMRKENVGFNTAVEIISRLEDENLIDLYFGKFLDELNMYNRGEL